MEAPPDPAPRAAAAPAPLRAPEVARLRQEQEKVVAGCRERIQHWQRVDDDYSALQERLGTLPDRLSYDIMVPFGPFAFMPGKLVHTNEVTVLLGDNWFAKCSAKQAVGLVEHRKGHVRKTIDDLKKVMTNFESRVEFTEDLQKMSDAAGDIVDIREEIKSDFDFKAKHRIAHKPHSKPKAAGASEAGFASVEPKDLLADQELWARLEELERQEELLGELESQPPPVMANGGGAASSEEEEEEEEEDAGRCVNGRVNGTHPAAEPAEDPGAERLHGPSCAVNGSRSPLSDEDGDEDEDEDGDGDSDDALGPGASCVPTIYFSHTVEPKRVRINTGKNTTLKFSEKREEARRKRKNGGGGHPAPEPPAIRSPADVYRVFVDLVDGAYVPRKSILKSRSRENSVCSDTSEGSAADGEERRGLLRSLSGEEAAGSDAGESIPEEEPEPEPEPEPPAPAPGALQMLPWPVGRFLGQKNGIL
ncbi:unnamed protein product [Pipistrellus nathusii]|uniref:URI1 prefoldin like chaperone n=1 Tax=Pipistrellus nathusii TaxID=59473 RepID=A0ABN9ZDZ3_PIPNA